MPYQKISSLSEALFSAGQKSVPITIQGRLHHTRKNGNMIFFLIREHRYLLQAIVFKKDMPQVTESGSAGISLDFKELLAVPRESVLRITGNLVKTSMLIETTGKNFELKPTHIQILSRAESQPPFQVEDLNQMHEGAEGYRPGVSLHHRLNRRYLDLRSIPNQALFRIRAGMERLIREYLGGLDVHKEPYRFVEIHTPKLIGIPSESGSSVFKVDYFGKPAFLAQSPQLYKQMMINSDFGRVFEIGAVYRAEKSISHRHLCEFMGLDLEMELLPQDPESESAPPHRQVYAVVHELLKYVWYGLNEQCKEDLAVLEQYYPRPGAVPDTSTGTGAADIFAEIPVLTFEEGAKMLTEAGLPQDPQEDLNNEAEQRLGQLVHEQIGSEIFWLEKYPTCLRPFYTMPNAEDPTVTQSYDLIFRGQEIASGAQRIHDYQTLLQNMKAHDLTPELYSDYLDSFRWGSPPHAGIGIGLERLLALLLNIPDVHCTTLLPRDPERLAP